MFPCTPDFLVTWTSSSRPVSGTIAMEKAMRRWGFGFLYAACGVLALGWPVGILAQGGQQTATRPQSVGASHGQGVSSVVGVGEANRSRFASAIEETASAELPDSPGAVLAQSQRASQEQSTPSQSSTVGSAQTQSAQSAPPADGKPQRPVGTAAAEAPTVSGVTAAEPAGVAIAPAKQRRVRTLVIKVGALVGVGVALGTTLALSAGTPSKPPGAH